MQEKMYQETREAPLVPRTTYRYLRHARGNPATELSGSLHMMGKAGKYCERERLPHISGESYHA
jgi:hypothetical protein